MLDDNIPSIDMMDNVTPFPQKEPKPPTEKQKKEKKPRSFPAGTIWGSSIGEILDAEFKRLLEIKEFSIKQAVEEINRMGDYCMYWNKHTKKPFSVSERALKNAHERHFQFQKERAFQYVRDVTRYNGYSTVNDVVAAIQKLIVPVLVQPRQAEVVAFGIAHWMWQVKRRLFGLEVENHLVIGFINEGLDENGQGSGKTTFSANICKPFAHPLHEQHLYANTDLDTLSDKKAWSDILGRLIAFLDDISPESKQEVATLKSIFTCNGTKAARGCYEKGLTSTKVLLSAMFTCNSENFGDVIKDVTGNRRYLPIHVLSFKGKISKDFDFLPFWQMIDHTWDCFTDMRMFRDMQKQHMTKNSLDLLLDMYGISVWKSAAESGDCISVYPRDIKLVLNRHFPKEKIFTSQAVTKHMEKLGFIKNDRGGPNKDRLVYLAKFAGNSFDRWQENFNERSSDNPDRRAPV